MGFERNYLVKNLSKLIIHKRLYHTQCEIFSDKDNVNSEHSSLLDKLNRPWFITGFVDAEGCFQVIIRKKQKDIENYRWAVEACLAINIHKKDLQLLKLIQSYFGGAGRIGKDRNGCSDFVISSLDDILSKIIPHFDNYPLNSKKLADYLLFKQIVMMMKRGEHLSPEGLEKIINIKASLNRGLSPVLKEFFPNFVPAARPLTDSFSHHQSTNIEKKDIVINKPLQPDWVAGFTSGDGCFKISIRESKSMKLGKRVQLTFVLTQHIRDELLLKSFVNFFSCGNCYYYINHLEYVSQCFKDNFEKILPFFRKYNILGVKSQDFNDWSKVGEMINSKAHLTKEGFNEIKKIKASMNKSRFIK